MTTVETIVVVAWAVGGLPIGLAFGVSVRRADEEMAGLAALMGWILAPLAAFVALVAGVSWVLDRAVHGADRRFPSRASRERDLRAREARVAQLEREVLR